MEKLSVTRSEVLALEIMKCQKLLAKLWAEDSRTAVLRRRRSLFRLLHNVPPSATDRARLASCRTTSRLATLPKFNQPF